MPYAATQHSPAPLLLFGPTASGKSALALQLAALAPSLVINADALQVYDGWRTLTARPAGADLAAAPHALYGHVALSRRDYSVGRWLDEASAAIAQARGQGLRPIVVGGTGLYFSALTKGLAEIPDIPDEIRAEAARRAEDAGEALFADLARRDPETAARIDRRNPRRLARAWEVLAATGEGLAAWTARTPPPPAPPGTAATARLDPAPGPLAERIAARLTAMARGGALEEVAAVEARRRLDPADPDALCADLPGLKALGAAAFAAHLRGETDLETAVEAAAAATRRYAKRQRTWGRNQLGDWTAIDPLAPDAADRLGALRPSGR